MKTSSRILAGVGANIRLRLHDGTTLKGTITSVLDNAPLWGSQPVRYGWAGVCRLEDGTEWTRTSYDDWEGPDGATAETVIVWSRTSPDPEEVIGDREQYAARFQEAYGRPFYTDEIQPHSGGELLAVRTAHKQFRDLSSKLDQAEDKAASARGFADQIRRDQARLRYTLGMDETLHADARLPEGPTAPVTLTERIGCLIHEGDTLVVTTPNRLTQRWAVAFIEAMVPFKFSRSSRVGVTVKSCDEPRPVNYQDTIQRFVHVYTDSGWRQAKDQVRGVRTAISINDLLENVEGVPAWIQEHLEASD